MMKKALFFAIILVLANAFSAYAVVPHEESLGPEWLSKYDDAAPNEKITVHKDSISFREYNKDKIVEDLNEYLSQHSQDMTGLPASDFKLHYSLEVPANSAISGVIYVEYRQAVEGLEIPNSTLKFMIKPSAMGPQMVHSRSKLFPGVTFPDNGVFDTNTLQQKAKEILDLTNERTSLIKEKQLVRYIRGQWRKVYEVYFDKSEYTAVVDMQTGESWTRDDKHYARPPSHTLGGIVQGRGVLFDPVNTPELNTLNLKDLKVKLNTGQSIYTNSNGSFYFTGLSPVTRVLSASLKDGRWAKINSCFQDPTCQVPDPDLLMEISVPAGQTTANIMFNPAGNPELITSRVNAYYHGTHIHNWIKERLPTFTAIDLPLLTFVNVSGNACNAGYSIQEVSTGYLKSGSAVLPATGIAHSCINMAMDTVIYHEYGHFLDDMAGGISFAGLGGYIAEGWGDLISSYVSGQPILGENAISPTVPGPGGFPRNANNNYQFNQMNGGYEYAELWAGFGWHLRENLMNHYPGKGQRMAEDLMVALLAANSETILWAIYDLFLIDDDDQNLFNGTPHLSEIAAALDYHGMPRLDLSFVPYGVPFIYPTIQSAINAAPDGTTIKVMNIFQFYDETINFNGKALTVQGIESPSVKKVLFISEEDRNSILENMNVDGGNAFEGAPVVVNHSAPTIRNCFFDYGVNAFQGGAVDISAGASPLLINNLFVENSSPTGGALACNSSTIEIINNTFNNNNASSGRAIYADNCQITMVNSIIWETSFTGSPIVLNNSSLSASYSDIKGGWPGEGNINLIPNVGSFYEPMAGSPLIDAGNGNAAPQLDFFGKPRVDDPAVVNTGIGNPNYTDIGAVERQLP